MFGPHDGTRVRPHPYRRMMLFLMRRRNESAVYFEQHLDLTKTLPWLADYAARTGHKATLFHLVLHGLASVLHERERLNRFTVGRRTFQRKHVALSFAAKKQMSDDAPLATVKRLFPRDQAFTDLVAQLTTEIGGAKSATPSAMDKELEVLLALPGFLLSGLLSMLEGLYSIGLAPRSLVDTDPLYTSAFVANLGSIKLDAAYHHLYEHGNCPLFVVIGQVREQQLTIRYTYDERVEDGLYCAKSLQLLAQRVEDPASWIS
jgi:hypothetical protein